MSVLTVLCESLLQGRNGVRMWFESDDVVGDREGQLDCLNQHLTRTFTTPTAESHGAIEKRRGKKVKN